MATPRTFSIFVLIALLHEHIGFTFRRLRHNPLTKSLPITATFEVLLADCGPIQQTETDLSDQVDDRIIEVAAVGVSLDQFAERVSVEALRLTNNNREHELYVHYFNDKPLHLFTKPVTGKQLTAMRKWPGSLGSSPHPTLLALAPELPPLLKEAEGVLLSKEIAEQKKSEFREVGERRAFVERVNAARKEAYGILSTLPHKHVGLPLNFADQFFRRDRAKPEEEVTLPALEEEISQLKEELEGKEALRVELKAAEEKAAKEAAEADAARKAAKVELAALQKELAEKQKHAAALMALIGQSA